MALKGTGMDDKDKQRKVEEVLRNYSKFADLADTIIDLFAAQSVSPVNAEQVLLTLAGLSIGMRAGSLSEPHIMAALAFGWMKGAEDGG